MHRRLPFRYIEPAFFAGLLDDPLLLVNMRPEGTSILFDCGQAHHLAKRVLKSIRAVFISHAHMDHFMGIDTLVRHTHVSPRTIDIFGPPGIAAKMAHKFAGYDWNLTEPYWCTFSVHEVFPDRLVTSRFPGSAGFAPVPVGETTRTDRTIYLADSLRVEADIFDHKLPSLSFRVTERESFLVDRARFDQENLVAGEWLRELKGRFYGGTLGGPLTILRQSGEEIAAETVDDATALYAAIRKEQNASSIGYLGDMGFSRENLSKARALLQGVTLLVCECSFLAADRDKARNSHHLCTDDVSALLEELRPAFLLPMHLSKTYIHRWEVMYNELRLPSGTTLLRIPPHVAPRPLITCELPPPCNGRLP